MLSEAGLRQCPGEVAPVAVQVAKGINSPAILNCGLSQYDLTNSGGASLLAETLVSDALSQATSWRIPLPGSGKAILLDWALT